MKQFISVADVPDITGMIAQALAYKADPLKDKHLGYGRRIGLIFFNPSLRSRLSTQIAAQNLGMEPVVFNTGADGWALELGDGAVMNGDKVEHVKDAAQVLGRYFDILCVRTFPGLQHREADYSEAVIRQFIRYSGIPVISLESATLHPLQSLADVITIQEQLDKAHQQHKPKVVLTWAPHVKPVPQCVANSFAQWMNAWDAADLTIVQPEGYELEASFTRGAAISYNQQEALAGADFIYVKSWSSYHHYGKLVQEPGTAVSWMLSEDSLRSAPRAKIMHCLPVRRNVELADSLLDGPGSLVTEQAANRIWSAQAVLSEVLKTQYHENKTQAAYC